MVSSKQKIQRRKYKLYHLRFKGDHYEIGVKRGKSLYQYFKAVCEEVKGITDSFLKKIMNFSLKSQMCVQKVYMNLNLCTQFIIALIN